jgi:hypothetical protein
MQANPSAQVMPQSPQLFGSGESVPARRPKNGIERPSTGLSEIEIVDRFWRKNRLEASDLLKEELAAAEARLLEESHACTLRRRLPLGGANRACSTARPPEMP